MPGINLYYGSKRGYGTGGRGSKWYRSKYAGNYRNLKSNYRIFRNVGQKLAASSQRDAATVVISRITSVPISILTETVMVPNPENPQQQVQVTRLTNGAVAINHWDQLRQSQYFPNYAPMFDQIKINSIRVKITGSQAGSAMTSNVSPAIVCAFDRNGLSVGQSINSSTISTYSSAQLKQWSTGNAFCMYQYIYPSTIMEKGQYLPTESLVESTGADAISKNPCNNLSDPTLPFKPITLLAVDMGGVVFSAAQTFSFTIEFEYNVTFRGMRKPILNTSAYSPLVIDVTDQDVKDGIVIYDEGPYKPVTINLSAITAGTPSTPTVPKFNGVLADFKDPSSYVPFTEFKYTDIAISVIVPAKSTILCFSRWQYPGENFLPVILVTGQENSDSGNLKVSLLSGDFYYIFNDSGEFGYDYYQWLSYDANTPIFALYPHGTDSVNVSLNPDMINLTFPDKI